MNLFLIGWSSSRSIETTEAEDAFSGLLSELPFFDKGNMTTWRAPTGRVVAACVAHNRNRVPDVEYVHFEPSRMALFSGRPFLWIDEFEADGRKPLDARFYLNDPERWSDALDGRVVAVRYDDTTGQLDLYTDPLGAYHLYAGRTGDTDWFSNSAGLIRRIVGARTQEPLVLASLVACGWSLGGRPLWEEVWRLPRASLIRLGPGGEQRRKLLPRASFEQCFERGLDSRMAARTLVATMRALADWRGRPSFVPLTGGRDSRLIFAAALRSEIDFEPYIGVGRAGDPENPEVAIARLVCENSGRSLKLARSRTAATIEDAARLLRLGAPGMLSLDLALSALNRPGGSGLEDDELGLPLPLVHTGHGGEIARAYYGQPDQSTSTAIARKLTRQITHLWPRPPLSREGTRLVDRYVLEWVNEQVAAGIAPAHVPDLFYLLERMGNWVGAGHGFDEHMADMTSPLWTSRLLVHQLGLSAADRSRELFHFHVLNELAPNLACLPFAGSNPSWPTFGRARELRIQRLRALTKKVKSELRRRYEYRFRRKDSDDAASLLHQAAALARARAPSPEHEVWQVLERRRALALLNRDPAGLDIRSARSVWRLATVFLACVD